MFWAAIPYVLQGVSSLMGGQSTKRAGAENARLELGASKDKARLIRRRAQEAKSAATAGFAASGVDVSEGTPLEVERKISFESELDALNELLTGKRRAAAVKAGANIAATQSSLSGVGSLYSGWLTAREQTANQAGT